MLGNNLVMLNKQKSQYRWLLLLSMIYMMGWIATYPMVYKMVEWKHILEPGAIFMFPLSYAIADVIAEVYGYAAARQIVWFSMFVGFIYCISLKFVANLPPPSDWKGQEGYLLVFSPILRAYFAITIASVLGNFINIYIISKFKILMCGRHFWLRSILSTSIGELVFTIVGGTLAYTGIEPISKIPFLMLDGYIFKMIYAFIAVLPVVLLATWLKNTEKIDIYDRNVDYNPFKISIL